MATKNYRNKFYVNPFFAFENLRYFQIFLKVYISISSIDLHQNLNGNDSPQKKSPFYIKWLDIKKNQVFSVKCWSSWTPSMNVVWYSPVFGTNNFGGSFSLNTIQDHSWLPHATSAATNGALWTKRCKCSNQQFDGWTL